jgi:hypothetical protein
VIPKIIHYCWFGEEAIPVEQVAYIEDWKKRHTDWEFMFWNEDNAPMQVPYLKNAKELRNWANMSNYVRLYAVKEHGGIYLDTDIKLVKDLTPLLDHDCFFGFEEFNEQKKTFGVNNAIFGAKKDHDFITSCHDELLVKFDGSEQADLSSPKLNTDLLIRLKGLSEYKEQVLGDIKLYPVEYFYPIHYSEAYKLNEYEKHIFPQTIAIHVWARTWIDKKKLIEAFDYLTYKTAEQEKYIAILQENVQLQEANANEINYWKQHFENEFNNLKLLQDRSNNLEKLSEKIAMQNDLLIKRIEILENKIQGISNETEGQSQELVAIRKDIHNNNLIRLFTNIFKKKV